MRPRGVDSVPALLEQVRFDFQPLVNINTGGIVAIEALARPAGAHVGELFREAARQHRLAELDVELAKSALSAVAEQQTLLPLHLNVFGGTVAHDLDRLDQLRERLHEIGRRAHEITLEIGPPFARLEQADLLAGIDKLRGHGFGIALDGVGEGDVPLTLVAGLGATTVKLDRSVVRALPDDRSRLAVVEAVRHLCEATDSTLVAEGVDGERQLTSLRHNGVQLVQGNLLARAAPKPPSSVNVPTTSTETTDPHGPKPDPLATGPRVGEFLSAATTLPEDVLADDVREVLAEHPEVSGVVLVDEDNKPRWTIDRNRFLLAVTGPYGHALHAKRPASRLADEARVVTTATTAMEVLTLVTGAAPDRMYDDAIVVDEAGRCLGAVRAGDLIRGMTERKVEEAAALNPLTRLPGSDAIAREVGRRIAAEEIFAVSWLDIDAFKGVNDAVGFSAADDLIRSIGRGLTDAATSMGTVQVGHVGGDDFLLVSDLEELHALAQAVLDPQRSAGGVEVSLSLATLVCSTGAASGYDEVSRKLAPLKERAKSLSGSSWVMSRADTDEVEVLRGTGRTS